MTTTSERRIIRYLGGQLGEGRAMIRGPVDGCWVVVCDGITYRIPEHLRKWKRFANRGKPPGRRRAQEPSIQMGLTLPVSVHQRIPEPRSAWVRRVIKERLMERRDRDYLGVLHYDDGRAA